MSDNKKYYYLKLKDNFFESDEMIVLESMPDGYMYSNILLKLYLRSLKNEGRLMFNERIPFNSTMLAQVTRHNIGVIEKAMNIFKDMGLIEILDNGAIYLTDIQNFIGEGSTEADRKRAYRQRIKTEQNLISGQMSGQTSDKRPPEIELELELELEKDIEIEIEDEKNIPRKIKFLEFVYLKKEEHEKLINDYGKDATNEYIQRLDDYLGSKGKKYKSHYHTIRTWIRKDEQNGKYKASPGKIKASEFAGIAERCDGREFD